MDASRLSSGTGNKRRELGILTSPLFLTSLFILLLNDFVLKAEFHNEITGKMSDFAGLTVFALFWCSFFPRLKFQIHIITALLFAAWKSPFSQLVIDGWNELSLFSVSRTTDYSDLIALLVLPLTYCWTFNSPNESKKRWAVALVSLISIFAFTATSFSKKTAYENEYSFSQSKKELMERMGNLPRNAVFEWHNQSDQFAVVFDSCIGVATISVTENAGSGLIRLTEIDYRCPNPPSKETMLRFFEHEFIDKLNGEGGVVKIEYIWAKRPEGYVNANQLSKNSNSVKSKTMKTP